MKKLSLILVIIQLMLVLAGCTSPDVILEETGDRYEHDLNEFEQLSEHEIPKTVLDTLDFMLENYTGGVEIPDPDELKGPDLTDDQIQQIIDNTPDVAHTREDVVAIILKAMSATEPNVAIKIDPALLAGTTMGDLIYESLYEQVGGTYIVESLGGVNYYWWSEAYSPDTNLHTAMITFSYFKDDLYDYGFSLDQVKQMKVELQQKAEQLVKDLRLNEISEYERVAAVNKYLMDTCTYTSGNPPFKMMQHTPYGALMYGDCVCEGYAKAAQLLFTLCDVDSYYVTGDTPTGGHAWNIVKVDGQWYQLDTTWNDTDGAPNQYFLVTDDYMKLSRVWDYEKFPKSAKNPYKR